MPTDPRSADQIADSRSPFSARRVPKPRPAWVVWTHLLRIQQGLPAFHNYFPPKLSQERNWSPEDRSKFEWFKKHGKEDFERLHASDPLKLKAIAITKANFEAYGCMDFCNRHHMPFEILPYLVPIGADMEKHNSLAGQIRAPAHLRHKTEAELRQLIAERLAGVTDPKVLGIEGLEKRPWYAAIRAYYNLKRMNATVREESTALNKRNHPDKFPRMKPKPQGGTAGHAVSREGDRSGDGDAMDVDGPQAPLPRAEFAEVDSDAEDSCCGRTGRQRRRHLTDEQKRDQAIQDKRFRWQHNKLIMREGEARRAAKLEGKKDKIRSETQHDHGYTKRGFASASLSAPTVVEDVDAEGDVTFFDREAELRDRTREAHLKAQAAGIPAETATERNAETPRGHVTVNEAINGGSVKQTESTAKNGADKGPAWIRSRPAGSFALSVGFAPRMFSYDMTAWRAVLEKAGMRCLPPVSVMNRDRAFWFQEAFRTGKRSRNRKASRDSKGALDGVSALKFNETLNEKTIWCIVRSDGVSLHVTTQTWTGKQMPRKRLGSEPRPSSGTGPPSGKGRAATGAAGRQRSGQAASQQAAASRASGTAERAAQLAANAAFNISQQAPRKSWASELSRKYDLNDAQSRKELVRVVYDGDPQLLRTVMAADPNRREFYVGIIKLVALFGRRLLDSSGGYAFANERLSAFDSCLVVKHADGTQTRCVFLRRQDRGGLLSTGRIYGVRFEHSCNQTARASRAGGVVCCSNPLHDVYREFEPVPRDRFRGRVASKKHTRHLMEFYGVPTDEKRDQVWGKTGFGRIQHWELERRVSTSLYRRKAGFVKDEEKLQSMLKTTMLKPLDGKPAQSIAEWQSGIPTSRSMRLLDYAAYVKYVVKRLREVTQFYAQEILR
ncbi:hypothetical protein DFJ74DRAFT_150191 [Hyaloraphidium curvatum]|nr:hypothetical protein DFJ74DRAFT_150191 [Hyaloraphidium curvatum]